MRDNIADTIAALRGHFVNVVIKNLRRCRGFEFDDLLQEASQVCLELASKARCASLPESEFRALCVWAFKTRCQDLARYASYRDTADASLEVLESDQPEAYADNGYKKVFDRIYYRELCAMLDDFDARVLRAILWPTESQMQALQAAADRGGHVRFCAPVLAESLNVSTSRVRASLKSLRGFLVQAGVV